MHLMEFLTKKTNELTKEEQQGIVMLFNEIFEKDRTVEYQINNYIQNVLGYSFHTFVTDGMRVIAHVADVPCYYNVNSEKKLFSDAVDGFVKREYRDAFILIEMFQTHRKYLKENGVCLQFGFPNEYAQKVYNKGKLFKKIGEMRTYFLPYCIGGIKPALSFMNVFSKTFCWMWVYFAGLFASSKKTIFMYEKDDETYNPTRYKRMDAGYSWVKENGCEFMYKVMEYEGIRTVFLIDVVGKSSKAFNMAVKYILKHEHNNFDLLLYSGNIYSCMHGMIKIPKKIEPKQFNFSIKILDNNIKSENIENIKNWDVNLSSYDLL